MDWKVFSKNLQLLIGDKNVSSVAKALGISKQTLRRYINCKSKARLLNLIKIAKYFGTTFDWLVGRKY